MIIALARTRREQLIAEEIIGPSDDDYEQFLAPLYEGEKKIRENGLQMVENWLLYFVGPFLLSNPVASNA
jgi:hypothetical protein